MKKVAFALFLFVGASFSSCEPEEEAEMKFNCVSGNCTENADGTYPTLLACEDACGSDVAYSCQNGNCVSMEGGTYPTLLACEDACGGNPPGCGGTFSSPLADGSGDCVCDVGVAGIQGDNGWNIIAQAIGNTGTHQFSVEAWTEDCLTCPSVWMIDPDFVNDPDKSYYAVGGSGTWSGSVFTLEAVMQTQEDYENGGTDTFILNATISCE